MDTKRTNKRAARIFGLALAPVVLTVATVGCDASDIAQAITGLEKDGAEVTVSEPKALETASQLDTDTTVADTTDAAAETEAPAEVTTGTVEVTYLTDDASTITASLLADDGTTIASAELQANTTYTLDGVTPGTYSIAIFEESEITADADAGLGWSRAVMAEAVTIDADTTTVTCAANEGCSVD
ncbi:MAG: hypothetical protein S0880_13510 [Actinomycetota bacterium]|nr:hypothetical protein [Actinomycetota bacterium]